MPPLPTPLSSHAGWAQHSIKKGDKGLNSRVMANGVQAHAMGAGDKVAGPGEDGGRGGRVGWGVAHSADDLGPTGVTRHGGAQQHIQGQSNREVLRVSKSKERLMGEGGVSIRQAAPEAKGAPANTAIKQAGTASRGGVTRVVKGKE